MSNVDDVLSAFQSDLERAQELLKLIKSFRLSAARITDVAASSLDVDVDVDVEQSEARLLASSVRTDLPILSGSLLLYICGRFEHFVREVVVVLADEIVGNSATYADLPATVRSELFKRTLSVAQAPLKHGYDQSGAEHLVRMLGLSLDQSIGPRRADLDAASLVIDSRVLAITESNMNSSTLADVFKRVDVKDLWVELGKQAQLKAHVGQKTDGLCQKSAKAALDELMKERNGIAHSTADTTFPDPDQVLAKCKFLAILSQVLVNVAQVPRA